MATYFHAGRHFRRPGDVIAAGHYGGMIDVHGPNHFHFARERTLDRVRRRRFGGKPSRLSAVFVCPTEAGVRRYIDESCSRHPGRVPEMVYEVELVAPGPVHLGDWRIPQALRDDDGEGVAAQYWAGCDVSGVSIRDTRYDEVVTLSPLRIVRRLP